MVLPQNLQKAPPSTSFPQLLQIIATSFFLDIHQGWDFRSLFYIGLDKPNINLSILPSATGEKKPGRLPGDTQSFSRL
jgi:hypothetical protein